MECVKWGLTEAEWRLLGGVGKCGNVGEKVWGVEMLVTRSGVSVIN